jgi:hypothetical protein
MEGVRLKVIYPTVTMSTPSLDRKGWLQICHNFFHVHTHVAKATTPSFISQITPKSSQRCIDETAQSDFHECAAYTYQLCIDRLSWGTRDDLESIREIHTKLQEATGRADWDACTDIRQDALFK